MTENFKKLTELQKKVGYKEGPPNSVAILGLYGESGEVLAEVNLSGTTIQADFLYGQSINVAKEVDFLKKSLRDKKIAPLVANIKNVEAYDKELADVLYYLNCLAINRGKTLDYYAGLSVEKVLQKSMTDIGHGTIK